MFKQNSRLASTTMEVRPSPSITVQERIARYHQVIIRGENEQVFRRNSINGQSTAMDMKELIEQDPLLGRWPLGIKITIRDQPSALNGHHVKSVWGHYRSLLGRWTLRFKINTITDHPFTINGHHVKSIWGHYRSLEMRELRSNKRKGAKVSISSVVTEMTQFSEEVFSPNSLDFDVVDTLWSDVHICTLCLSFSTVTLSFSLYQAQWSIRWDQITVIVPATKSHFW